MSGSGFFWQIYELLLKKSVLDDMDLEMVEEYCLRSEQKALISSKVLFRLFHVRRRNCFISFTDPVIL